MCFIWPRYFANTFRYINIPVASNAFEGCKLITKVIFGCDVKSIGERAFAGCINLKQ